MEGEMGTEPTLGQLQRSGWHGYAYTVRQLLNLALHQWGPPPAVANELRAALWHVQMALDWPESDAELELWEAKRRKRLP